MIDLDLMISDFGLIPGVKTFEKSFTMQPIENMERDCPAVLVFEGKEEAEPSAVGNRVEQNTKSQANCMDYL